MKKYYYYYNGQPITKKQFLQVVPENWELEIEDNYYSYGYYSVIIN